MSSSLIMVTLIIVAVGVLYVVVETMVKKGIDGSVIGQFLETKPDMKGTKNSLLDHGVDQNS